jgi:glutaredoxin
MLQELEVEFDELDVTIDPYREEVVRTTGCYSVPQLVFGDRHVGNYDAIVGFYKEKRLKEQLV